jgi:hypothetical protein
MSEPYVNPWLTLTYTTAVEQPPPKRKSRAKPATVVARKKIEKDKPSAYGRQYLCVRSEYDSS